MLFLRNIQAQKPDFLFFCYKTEEDISQNLCSIGPLSLWERAGVRASARTFTLTLTLSLKGEGENQPYEYFFVRRVGAVFAGSSGQTCLG
ncbi:hypothetical protein AWF71_22655 [Escherichia coli]|nr:hypothetical protein AWF71_22655 [Escherichia coli]